MRQRNFTGKLFLFRLFHALPRRAEMRSIGRRDLAVRDQLGDDATDLAWQEWFLDHGTAALGDELAQRRGQRIPGHEDDARALSGPALFDLVVEGAPVEVGHTDIRED